MLMMTKKEFYTKKADEAFEVAVRTVQRRRNELGMTFVNAADAAHEQELILWEWWDDYLNEYV